MTHRDSLPSIEWKQPRKGSPPGDGEPKYENQVAIAGFGLFLWAVPVRMFIHSQLYKYSDQSFEGYVTEVLTDPIVWGLAIWLLVVYNIKDNTAGVPSIGEGLFDCPHCGKELLANEQLMNAQVGWRSSCALCGNEYIKRSPPPRL